MIATILAWLGIACILAALWGLAVVLVTQSAVAALVVAVIAFATTLALGAFVTGANDGR